MDCSIGIESRNDAAGVSLRPPVSHGKSRVLGASDSMARILDPCCIDCPWGEPSTDVSLPEIGECAGLEMNTGDIEMPAKSTTVESFCVDKIMVLDATDCSRTSKTASVFGFQGMERQAVPIYCNCQLSVEDAVSGNWEQWPADQAEEADVMQHAPFLCRKNPEDEVIILSGYETPEDDTFDPFAPGAEELAFAPMKRTVKEFRPPLRRWLEFDNSDFYSVDDVQGGNSGDSVDDDRILRALYLTLLDVALSNQVENNCDVCLPTEPQSSPEPKTPTALPLLTGIAESCPGAPLRHVPKSRKISLDVCRKLDFSTSP